MDYKKEQQLNVLGNELSEKFGDIIIDVIFANNQKNIFLQKRAADAKLFPGAWEFPGGHLDAGETLSASLRRIAYEIGNVEVRNTDVVHIFTWDENRNIVNIQILVQAEGTKLNGSWVDHKKLPQLFADYDSSPIYRGAIYALNFLHTNNVEQMKLFARIPNINHLTVDFLAFLKASDAPPIVTIGNENEKRFRLDRANATLSISPSFLRHYDNDYEILWIILHQIVHNYCQNIVTFDNVKSIRSNFGKNTMFYVDIVADLLVYEFLRMTSEFNPAQLVNVTYNLRSEYQGETVEASKLTRLLGSALAISRRMNEVFLPVLDENTLRILRFDKFLRYAEIDASTIKTSLKRIATDPKISYEKYNTDLRKALDCLKGEI